MTTNISSPITSLIPFISAEQAASMAYPPNALPGGRDVSTFYGSMRVYEWGPLDGEKVIFVHGDATPSLVFSQIAQSLVNVGFRVMLFDLWGRGYSATPLNVNHEIRLFAAQTLLALTTSPISWMGNGITFSMVGHSLGGPISLAFAGAFPSSVRSMVLFGPAGLLRKLPEGYDDPILLNPLSQEALRDKVQEVLGVSSSGPVLNISEIVHPLPPLVFPSAVNQTFDLPALLQWQFDHNEGHVHAFQESTKYGPLQHQEDVWAKVCDIIAGKTHPESPLYDSTLLVYFGDEDNIVVRNETTEDILKLLPVDHLKVEHVPGGHSFPYANSETIAQGIISFWGSKGSKLY